MKHLARWWAFVLASAPAFVFACEGEEAMARIERSEQLGWILLGVSCMIALISQTHIIGTKLFTAAILIMQHAKTVLKQYLF